MAIRVLAVDDEESIRYTFREFLSEAGYQVDTADTLIEAADMVLVLRDESVAVKELRLP